MLEKKRSEAIDVMLVEVNMESKTYVLMLLRGSRRVRRGLDDIVNSGSCS